MSADSSDSEAEFGSANARAAPSSLAALHAQNLQPLIDEENWHNKEPPDFHVRTVARQYRNSSGSQGVPRSRSRADSDTSSMAVSVHNSSAWGGSVGSINSSSVRPPSLASSSIPSSNSSAQTNLAGTILRLNILEEADDGVLRQPSNPAGKLGCSFNFLNCSYSSDDHFEWDTHCRWHFKNHLPATAHCPFSCDWSSSADVPYDAWEERIRHIVSCHRSQRYEPKDRAENWLIEHLWQHSTITRDEYKDLNRFGRLGDNRRYMTSEGPSRDRRRRRRP